MTGGGPSARDGVLGRIRRALGAADDAASRRHSIAERLEAHPRGPSVARGQGDLAHRTALFLAKAEEAAATVAVLRSPDEIPEAVAAYLRDRNLPATVRLAPDATLVTLPWSSAPTVAVTQGPTDGSDTTSLTGCIAGIAETGTLMLASGETMPVGLAFLPENHIVVLRKDQLVAGLEEAWDMLRAARGPNSKSGAPWPRAINFITGPSRSADIEQTLQMGAHGPKRLHILLIDG